jgi:hypothetical protein
MSDLIPDLQTYKEAMAAWQSAPAGSRPTPTLAAIQAAFPAYRFKILRNGSNGWRNGTLLVDLVMAGLMPVAANQILITQGQIQSVATITEINWADGSTYTAVLISGDGKRTIRGSIGTGGTQFVASGNLVAANGLGSMAVVVTLPQVTAPPPAPAPTPTPTPTALSVSAALRDMVARNSNDWGPALNPVWGFNSEGDPATGSYAYIDTGIRAADVGPTGAIGPHYPANATLDNTGFVGVGETVQKFPWWVLDDAFQKRNVSTNTRVQMADMGHIVYGLDGSILQSDSDTMHRSLSQFGSLYWFWGDYTIVIPDGNGLDQARLESDGFSIGAIGMNNYAGRGWCIHGFPLPVYRASRNTWVNNVAGSVVFCRARKILHDPNGPDDRSQSGLMLNLGADYSVPGVRMIGASMHNRWCEITNDWQWFYCTDMNPTFFSAHIPPGWIA